MSTSNCPLCHKPVNLLTTQRFDGTPTDGMFISHHKLSLRAKVVLPTGVTSSVKYQVSCPMGGMSVGADEAGS